MDVIQLETSILDVGLRHINFFNGRLLSGEDLSAERDASHVHLRHLGQGIGAGVASGLEVSRAQNSPLSDTQVQIKAGLAVNKNGQVLHLKCDQTVSLVRPPDPAKQSDCVFSDCAPFAAGSALSGGGYYLLTIAPASQREGLAPISGLGNSPAPCNSRYFTEGVQFRLLPLNLAPIGDPKRVRNEVAYQCFGIGGRSASQFISDALLEVNAAPYGCETLVVNGRLTDQDVPLAVIQWSKNAGLGFLDRWSVRRRVVRPHAAKSWGYFTDYRRRAEAEAIFQQFQEELSEIQQEPGVPQTLAAGQRFKYLPPAGLLPVGASDFNWKLFLGPHAPKSEIPLDVEQARALLWRSMSEEPVPVVAASNAATAVPAPVRFHVYRLAGQTGLVLFVRSALGEVVAEDVYYDNSACCLEGVQTVQAALDVLCRARDGCCTLVATPRDGWEKIFSRIPKGGDASVCFPVGNYPLSGPVIVEGKGHLRLTGCGFGSRIAADKSETALVFKGCASVSVSHLSAQSGLSGAKGSLLNSLNGTFTFLDCGSVVIEGAAFRCAPDGQTNATCVTVRNTPPTVGNTPATEARLRGCELIIGGEQIGALFINVARTQVEDNVLRAEGKPAFVQLTSDSSLYQGMKRQLVAGVVAGAREAAAGIGGANASVTYAGHEIHFQTHAGLVGPGPAVNAWQKAIDNLQPMGIDNPEKLKEFVTTLADQVLAGRGQVGGLESSVFPKVVKEIAKQPAAVAFGGIWIAGEFAPEVRVLNNSIEGVLAGVHVGLSHREQARRGSPDQAGVVSISGNRIQVRLPSYATTERHGIFVGNVISLVIENNFVTCESAPNVKETTIEGIRIYGFLGRLATGGRIIIRANHLQGFRNIGILFNPLNAPPPEGTDVVTKPWIIAENLAEAARDPVQIRPGFEPSVRLTDNYN